MSYNIRLDVESDGVNQWDNRKEGLVSLIKDEKPDVLGIQEGLPHQIKYLSNQLEVCARGFDIVPPSGPIACASYDTNDTAWIVPVEATRILYPGDYTAFVGVEMSEIVW